MTEHFLSHRPHLGPTAASCVMRLGSWSLGPAYDSELRCSLLMAEAHRTSSVTAALHCVLACGYYLLRLKIAVRFSFSAPALHRHPGGPYECMLDPIEASSSSHNSDSDRLRSHHVRIHTGVGDIACWVLEHCSRANIAIKRVVRGLWFPRACKRYAGTRR